MAKSRTTKRPTVKPPPTKPRPTISQLRPKPSTTASKEDPHPPFRLLDLPPEIRCLIYSQHFAPVSFDVEVPCVSKPESVPLSRDRYRHPALLVLETCRQVYQEAYHLFYQQNAFSFRCATNLYAFLLRIGQARREQIRGINLCGFPAGHNVQNALHLLRTCHRLWRVLCVRTELRQSKMAFQEEVALINIGFVRVPQTRVLMPHRSYIMERPVLQEVTAPEKVDLFNQKRERVQRTEVELLLDAEAGKGYYCYNKAGEGYCLGYCCSRVHVLVRG